MRIQTSCLLMFACIFFQLNSAFAEDWARFRGPNGDGKSSNTSIPLEWSEKTNLKWKTEMPGFGSSSPIVYGDRIYLTCYSGYGLDKRSPGNMDELKRHLVCVNRADGKIVWTTDVENKHEEDRYRGYIQEHGYASNTPVTDGKLIYAFFGKAGLYAYDMNGKEKWSKDLGDMSSNRKWGTAASLVLVDDLLVVNANEESRTIFAFDKTSGKEVWKIPVRMQLAYSTPALVTLPDNTKELVIGLPTKVIGVDPKIGKEKWSAKTHQLNNLTPCPIVDGDIVYLYGGYRGSGSIAIRCGGSGDVTNSHVLWTSKDSSYVGTPVLHKGYIYWVNERGLAYCVNAKNGKQVYKERLEGLKRAGGMPFYASMILVGDKMLAVSRRSGTFVVAAKPEFEQLGLNSFESDESDFNGTPAIAGDQLLIRSDEALYCIGKVKYTK